MARSGSGAAVARAASRRAQHGQALLGLLAVAVMVFAYVLTSRLNAASQFVALDREDNAKVLARAKQALSGYMAQQAALPGENNPGHLPCPEAPANFGTANEGIEAPFCASQAVGRLPWRTLGLDKLVDASGEPLWYAVSNGWHRPSSSATLTINSESAGQLALDGVANDVVALIIAPGPAITAQAGTGCTAWAQSRPTSGAPDFRNYLECENANTPADASFVSNRAGQTFNDQVLRVTVADVLPALEAAIAERAQREIAPALRNAAFVLDSNSPRRWVVSSSNPPIYPYATPFGDPAASNFQGAAGTYQGLLPFAPSAGFVAYAATPADAVETMGNGTIETQTCSWETANEVYVCEGEYKKDSVDPSLPMRIEMTATFTSVAMGFRSLDPTRLQATARNTSSDPWINLTVNYQADVNDGGTAGKPHGSVTVRFWADLPNIPAMGWGTKAQFLVRIERAIIADHCLLSTAAVTCAGFDTSWFARNQWHRNFYYAVAQNNTAAVLPSVGGCDSTNCLRFNDPGTRNIRVLLVLAGRRLDTQARPSASLSDYVEYQNGDLGTLYEQRPMRMSKVALPALNAPMNDRLVLVDWITPAPSFPLASLP